MTPDLSLECVGSNCCSIANARHATDGAGFGRYFEFTFAQRLTRPKRRLVAANALSRNSEELRRSLGDSIRLAKSGDLGSFGTLPTQLMHLDKNAYAVLPCAGPCVVDNRGAWCRRGIRETSNDPLLVLTRYSLSHSRTWVSSCPRQGSLGRSI